jgi:hypothetical protein
VGPPLNPVTATRLLQACGPADPGPGALGDPTRELITALEASLADGYGESARVPSDRGLHLLTASASRSRCQARTTAPAAYSS